METEVIPFDQLTKIYRKMKAKIDELTKEYDSEVEKLKAQLDEIKIGMKEQMKATGVSSVKTEFGTVSFICIYF